MFAAPPSSGRHQWVAGNSSHALPGSRKSVRRRFRACHSPCKKSKSPGPLNCLVHDGSWAVASVPIESVEHAMAEFLRLGTDIEVLRPPELRERIARTVAELAERYGNSAAGRDD
jgi:predicted DNA-binding transcriptional regulator YafY